MGGVAAPRDGSGEDAAWALPLRRPHASSPRRRRGTAGAPPPPRCPERGRGAQVVKETMTDHAAGAGRESRAHLSAHSPSENHRPLITLHAPQILRYELPKGQGEGRSGRRELHRTGAERIIEPKDLKDATSGKWESEASAQPGGQNSTTLLPLGRSPQDPCPLSTTPLCISMPFAKRVSPSGSLSVETHRKAGRAKAARLNALLL